jgi:hypothetical protein
VKVIREAGREDKPDKRELVAARHLLEKKLTPTQAIKAAGFKLPPEACEQLAEGITKKYNLRMAEAYMQVGLTPEYLAQKQMGIIESEDTRPGDKLKAIDQILSVVGGYAAKQVDVTTVSFEQAVIDITNTVDISTLRAKDVRKMLTNNEAEVTDAELVE